jgi:hypothetical protein
MPHTNGQKKSNPWINFLKVESQKPENKGLLWKDLIIKSKSQYHTNKQMRNNRK